MNKQKNSRPSRAGSHSNRAHSSSKPKGFKFKKKGAPNKGGFKSKRGAGRNNRKMPSFNPSVFINTNPIEQKQEVYTPVHESFSDFAIDEMLTKVIASMGIKTPSPIQDQAIAPALEGKDVIGLAETGTGKTLAFLTPLIQHTIKNKEHATLILAPTRELAIQIQEEARRMSRNIPLYSVTCVGGMNIQPQIRTLKRKNHFIIGTPGRILDLINKKHIKTNEINALVLDEADRMLDMGFIHDMKKIISSLPKERQTLFFSATMTKEAEGIIKDFMKSPVTISVKKKDVVDSIRQDVIKYKKDSKLDTLKNLFTKDEYSKVIIFGSMKHSVEKLSKDLSASGVKATSIHGNKSHGQRQRALKAFKGGEFKVLVATDVAARGIHVDDVSHVINYDLPQTMEDYVHRIGRTGRGTKRGEALTFVPK
jgi:superfamily II DNA/RNA helicase